MWKFMTNAMKRLLCALRPSAGDQQKAYGCCFNKGKCYVYWVYEMTLGNGTTGMAVTCRQEVDNKTFFMNENHERWYSLRWWHVCSLWLLWDTRRKKGVTWRIMSVIPSFSGIFLFMTVLLNAYFNDNYGERLLHCSLFWHGSAQMTVPSPTTRVSAACMLTRKDESAKFVSKWERSFSCILIKQVRRIWREKTGSVWTGNEVEDHGNKRMSVFVCRHLYLQVPDILRINSM